MRGITPKLRFRLLVKIILVVLVLGGLTATKRAVSVGSPRDFQCVAVLTVSLTYGKEHTSNPRLTGGSRPSKTCS